MSLFSNTQKAGFLMQRLFHEFDTLKWVAAQESLFSGLGTIPVLARDIDQNARNQLAKHKQFI